MHNIGPNVLEHHPFFSKKKELRQGQLRKKDTSNTKAPYIRIIS
jgi:hypothetical protein